MVSGAVEKAKIVSLAAAGVGADGPSATAVLQSTPSKPLSKAELMDGIVTEWVVSPDGALVSPGGADGGNGGGVANGGSGGAVNGGSGGCGGGSARGAAPPASPWSAADQKMAAARRPRKDSLTIGTKAVYLGRELPEGCDRLAVVQVRKVDQEALVLGEEPSYTIQFPDGTERETTHSKLDVALAESMGR